MESTKTKACKMCTYGTARADEKYCSTCRDKIKTMMTDSGYFSDARDVKPLSEQRARSQRHGSTVGGSAELNSDGDE